MHESALTLLKFLFLALVYIFLFLIVRVVLRELRAPALLGGSTPGTAAPAARKAGSGKAAAALHVLAPESRRGETVPIDTEVTIGRGGGCALVLSDDQYASTVHARLFRRGRDLFVDDLESRNGTFVNGERISSTTKVRKGDRIQIGQTVCQVTR